MINDRRSKKKYGIITATNEQSGESDVDDEDHDFENDKK